MATIQEKKLLQLLRSQVFDTKADAEEKIGAVDFGTLNYDGTPMVVRYKTSGETPEIKSLFVIWHNTESKTGYTVFDNADEATKELETLKSEISNVIGIDGIDGKGGKDANQLLAEELDDTTYAKNGATDNGETIIDAIKALDDAIVANEVTSDDNSITVTKSEEGTDVSVNVDGKTIVIATGTGEVGTALEILYVPADKEAETPVEAHIALIDAVGTELSTVNVSELIGNGQLTSSSYDKTTGILTLTFNMADGSTRDVEIDLKAMLDIDDVVIGEQSQNYLSATTIPTTGADESNLVLDVKIVNISEATSDKTGLVDAWDVKQTLDASDAELSALEAAVGGEYVPATSDTDAKFDLGFETVEYAEPFASKDGVANIDSADTVVSAIEKVESSVKVLVDEVLDNEEVTEKAIEAVASAAGVINNSGVIVYTQHTNDNILSGATNLDAADVALAEAIRKVEEELVSTEHTVVTDADDEDSHLTVEKIEHAKSEEKGAYTEFKLDVNFDFGTITLG